MGYSKSQLNKVDSQGLSVEFYLDQIEYIEKQLNNCSTRDRLIYFQTIQGYKDKIDQILKPDDWTTENLSDILFKLGI